jgi:hypothetical protein
MLGHDALGRWALGQLPSVEAGAAVAPGAILPLTLTLVAGAASGEGVLPPVVIGGFPRRRDAIAHGARFDLWLSLRPGRAFGVDNHQDAAAAGAVLPLRKSIAAGTATGDATGYDNDLVLLLAA